MTSYTALDPFALVSDFYTRGLADKIVIDDVSVKLGETVSFVRGTVAFKTKGKKEYAVEALAVLVKELQAAGGPFSKPLDIFL